MGDDGSIAMSIMNVSVWLPTILFIPPLQQIKDTTLSENWHVLCTVTDEKDFISGTRVMAALHWTKLVVCTYGKSFAVTPVAFSESL